MCARSAFLSSADVTVAPAPDVRLAPHDIEHGCFFYGLATLSLFEVEHPCCSKHLALQNCRCVNEGNTVTEIVEKRYADREDHPTWKTYATMHPSCIRTYIVHIYLFFFYLHYIRCLSFSSFKSGIWMKSRIKMSLWPSLLLWRHAAH